MLTGTARPLVVLLLEVLHVEVALLLAAVRTSQTVLQMTLLTPRLPG